MDFRELRSIPDGGVIALVDIGSGSISILICQFFFTIGKINIISKKKIPIISAGSNINNFLNSIYVHIYEIEEKKLISVSHVLFNISNKYVELTHVRSSISLSENSKISIRYIDELRKNSLSKINSSEYFVIDIHNSYYTVDQNMIVMDPIGLKSSFLAAHFFAFIVKKNIMHAFNKLYSKINLKTLGYIPSGYAATISCKTKADDIGVTMFIIMGNKSSDLCIFEDGFLLDTHSVPIGGYDITKEIARLTGASISDAEFMKRRVCSLDIRSDSIIDVHDFPSLSEQKILYSDIRDIINDKLKKILLLIDRAASSKFKKYDDINSIVLGGSLSYISNSWHLAKKILKHNCRTVEESDLVDLFIKNEPGDQKGMIDYLSLIGSAKHLIEKRNNLSNIARDGYFSNKLYKISCFLEDLFY